MNSQNLTPANASDAPLIAADPRDGRARLHFVLGRVAHWTPVIAALILFAQVSFLGLRPALSEASRLAAAEEVLAARHARAVSLNREIALQLHARQDPLFRERQHRLRTAGTPATKPSATGK